MNKSLAAMNGALGSRSPLLLLFAAFRGNFLCPLRGSNSFLQMWSNLSAPGVAAHPCTKQGLEKWGYTREFFCLFPQQASPCPIIQRGTLANSAAAYYCNCMCTILHLMQAGCVNRKKAFWCTVIENYWGDVKPCWVLLPHCSTNISTAPWLHWILPVPANSISLLSPLIILVFDMDDLFDEQDFFSVSREPLFLFTTAAQLKALLNSYAVHATYPEASGI